DRQGPVAGDDQLRRDLRVDRAGAHRERVDVPQYLWNRLGRDEAELLRLGRMAGDDTVQVLALVDVAEVAADVLRMLAVGPERAERPGSRKAQQESPAIESSSALLHSGSFSRRFPPGCAFERHPGDRGISKDQAKGER